MYKRRSLLLAATEYSIALSLLNVDMLCRQLGCAYYDCNNHGIVLLYINPVIIISHTPRYVGLDNQIVGLKYEDLRIASEILILQNSLYSFKKDRFNYSRCFSSQQDYVNYINRCQDYTMNCYKLDGIL